MRTLEPASAHRRSPVLHKDGGRIVGIGHIHEHDVKTAYRRWAPVYDHTFGFVAGQGRRHVVEEINKLSGRVLEVGVGTGLSLVSPTLFFVVVLRVMSALKVFDVIYMLIKDSNPAFNKGVSLMVLFYREAFVKFNKGYASAIVLWSFVIIGVLTAVQFFAEKKLVHYD